MPRISVIIPVYNVQDYLAECLDSVLAQTFADFEAVCVNDGSSDSSRAILENYACNDNRIVIVNKENGGLSSARNAGLNIAQGSYVCFLDSDDTLCENALQVIVETFEKGNADVVTFGAHAFPEEDSENFRYLNMVLSPRRVSYFGFDTMLLFEESSHPYIWRTACDLSFLREKNLRFAEGLIFGEDEAFYFALYPRASRVDLIPDKLLNYRATRPGSLMDSMKGSPESKILAHFDIMKVIFEDWEEQKMLPRFEYKMFEWACDFVLYDLYCLEYDARVCCADILRQIWKEYFSEECIEYYEGHHLYGKMVHALYRDPVLMEGKSRRSMLWHFSSMTRGKISAVKRYAKIAFER